MFELRTGCRIHFGLMELRQGLGRCYAGLGLMLNHPQLTLRFRQESKSPSSFPQASTKFAPKIRLSNASIVEYQQRINNWIRMLPANVLSGTSIQVEVIDAYPFHCGLGTGTQLAGLLAIAGELLDSSGKLSGGKSEKGTCLSDDWQSVVNLLPNMNSSALTERTGRGRRSGIGVCGFLHGNLILDSGLGVSDGTHQTCRARSVPIPDQWQFVLIRHAESSHITGRREQELMQQTAGNHTGSDDRMWQLASACCEAAQKSDFSTFADRLEQYLELAAGLFASVQGGKFNGTEGEKVARVAVESGLRAVGQSSWGPTIFGAANDKETATRIVELLTANYPNWTVQATSSSTTGAQAKLATRSGIRQNSCE